MSDSSTAPAQDKTAPAALSSGFTDLEIAAFSQRNIPLNDVQALLDAGYTTKQVSRLLAETSLPTRAELAALSSRHIINADSRTSERDLSNAYSAARDADSLKLRQTYNRYNSLIEALVKDPSKVPSIGELIDTGVEIGDGGFLLNAINHSTIETILTLTALSGDVNWALRAEANSSWISDHHHVEHLEPTALIRLRDLDITARTMEAIIMEVGKYHFASFQEMVLSSALIMSLSNSVDVSSVVALASQQRDSTVLERLLHLVRPKDLLDLYHRAPSNDRDLVDSIILSELPGEWQEECFSGRVSIDEAKESVSLGLDPESFKAFKDSGRSTGELRSSINLGIPVRLLALVYDGVISSEELSDFMGHDLDFKALAVPLRAGVPSSLVLSLAVLFTRNPEGYTSLVSRLLASGMSTSDVLTVVEGTQSRVYRSQNRKVPPLYDSNGVPFKDPLDSTGRRAAWESRLAQELESSLKNMVPFVEELYPVAVDKLTPDTFWALCDLYASGSILSDRFPGNGGKGQGVNVDAFLAALKSAKSPREVNAALKPLNQLLVVGRGDLVPEEHFSWDGSKLVASKSPGMFKDRPAASSSSRELPQVSPQVPTGSLGECYTRVGAVVDWYAVVLTDKLWTPDNAPAIIDTRSTLFHELESLLIEVQDDPAMSGTLNVELDGVDLSQPAPVSLESLATRLEQAMQSAWAKAAELGKEYPMVEESRPVEQDVQEQLDDLEVEETSLRAEVAKDRRRANLILRNTEATVEGDNARAQAERLLARANANETKASGLSKEATRLRMGTDSIATRVRLLASNPRLQGSAKRAIGPAD